MPFLALAKNHPHRILLALTSLLVLVLGICTFIIPPGVDPDPCWGLMIMHNMEHGGNFNQLVSPAFKDINQTRSEFLSWWSPGQYMVPYFFKLILKLTTGRAVALTVSACSVIGLAGYYRLFKLLKFSKWISALSIAFIACQLFFLLPFTYYLGGESALFAFSGWCLYWCFLVKKINGSAMLFVLAMGLVGFFCKSSFLWMYAAAICCIWINVSAEQTASSTRLNLMPWLKNGLLLAIPFMGSLVLIYVFYLSKGDNPTSDQIGILFRPETFGFPLAAPVTAGFSVDELTGGLIYQPDKPWITYTEAIVMLMIFMICSIAFLVCTIRRHPDRKYPLLITSFYIVSALFFGYMFLKQATISYEGRHFRILGLLFIPGFIQLLYQNKLTRRLFFVIWIGSAWFAFSICKTEYRANYAATKGNTLLSQQLYDETTMRELLKLDNAHHNDAIFAVMSSDIAAELQNNRIITFDGDTPVAVLKTLKYHGTAGPLYVLMPKNYLEDGRGDIILGNFLDYHHFTTRQLSKDYYLYTAEK